MIYGLLLIFLGILAVPSLLLSKQPNAKDLLDKIAPYQGYIGIVFCIIGIIGIIKSLLNIELLSVIPIYWIIYLSVAVVEAALGFILGYSLIQHYALSKNTETSVKGAALLAKLRPLQGKLGMAAIVLGVIEMALTIYYHI